MRLHRLVIEGIGPYATRQELDLDELSAHGLFLLTGPTGAGKSTVLDAIVFALFGTVAGARGGADKGERHRAKRGMVSDLRELSTTPVVELEFTLGERRFTVRRTPEHERPALRGGGTTTAKQAATLSELTDDGWTSRSTDFAEIGTELQELLGMNAEQFTQVVLLPQGQFAGFLRAPVKERRAILERLFRVDRFQAAEQWLEQAARDAREAEASATAQLRELVARLSGALGPRAGAPPEAELHAVTAWVEQQRFDAEGLAEVTAVDLASARSRAEAAGAALATARRAEESANELRARRAERAELDARLAKAGAWLKTTAWAHVAERPDGWEAALTEAQTQAAELQAARTEAQRAAELARRAREAVVAAEAAEQAAQHATALLPNLAAELEQARRGASAADQAAGTLPVLEREHARLDGQLAAARQAADFAQRRAETEQRLIAAAEASRAADAALAALPDAAALDAAAEAIVAAQREAAAAHATADAALADAARAAGELSARMERARALQHSAEPLRSTERAAIDAAQAARHAYLAAREARLDAMAAELAADLSDEQPCPVCGSTEHPAPAPAHPGGDLRTAEQQAQLAAEASDAERAAAERAVAAVDAELAALDAPALPSLLEAAEQAIARARSTLAEAAARVHAEDQRAAAHAAAVAGRRAAHAEADAARHAMVGVRDELAQLDQRLAAVRAQVPSDLASAQRERDELGAELARLRQAIADAPSHRDRAVAVEQRLERVRSEAAAHREAAAGHRRTAEALRAQHRDAQQRLQASHPGGDLDAATEAARQAAAGLAEADRLQRQAPLLTAAIDDLAARVAELTGDQPQQVQGASDEQLAEAITQTLNLAQAAAAAAGDQLAAAQTAAADADRCVQAAREAATQLETLASQLGPAAEEAERLRRLDATVRGQGDNARRMSLTTYVLAARLEQVAAAATEHLQRMSSGRYALVHHDDRYGNAQAGLGLRVRDAWSGEQRDTATLSGGESFQASLALALGLAEVVQHEAGGRRLETLLVDEGFGSLDPAALDEVLGELDELRASGRVIGLVSHVPAMAERIPSQLQITPGRSGSTARVALAGLPA